MDRPSTRTLHPPYAYGNDGDSINSLHTDYGSDNSALSADDPPAYDASSRALLPSTSRHARTRDVPSYTQPKDSYAVLCSDGSPDEDEEDNKPHDIRCKISETTARIDKRLSDPDALFAYVSDYLRVSPPRPIIRIDGYHERSTTRNGERKTERVYDFDIVLGLEAYLGKAFDQDWHERIVANIEKVYRGSWRKTTATNAQHVSDEPTKVLRDWCEDYCASRSPLKVFRVHRPVTGLDKDLLRRRLDHLVRATGYRGRISITFPTEQQNVDIYSHHPINQWRTGWVRVIFYLTFLWIITWPILFFTTKWWHVYTVEWRFSVAEPDGRERRYAGGVTEEQWYEKYEESIYGLVVSKCKGDATKRLEARVGPSVVQYGQSTSATNWGHDT
ncbi:hypothetical protein LTR95_004263 [Oleoguttula sp. CCFEE 5521]